VLLAAGMRRRERKGLGRRFESGRRGSFLWRVRWPLVRKYIGRKRGSLVSAGGGRFGVSQRERRVMLALGHQRFGIACWRNACCGLSPGKDFSLRCDQCAHILLS
jgi:hypothetical protein